MKNISSIRLTLLFALSSQAFAADDCSKILKILKSDPVAQRARYLGDSLDMERVKRDLDKLTGVSEIVPRIKIKDRYRTKNKDLVIKFITEEMNGIGLEVTPEDFGSFFRPSGKNLIVEIKGSKSPQEVYEYVAHYDSSGKKNPGADDNGTGVALGLELARLFHKNPPQKTIRFVFADLEESGSHGSEAHVRALKYRNEKIEGAFVVDMIGYHPDKAEQLFVVEVGTSGRHRTQEGFEKSTKLANLFLYQFNRYNTRGKLKARADTDDAKPYTGDHGSYWDRGYPAIFISAPYEGDYVNPENHSREDTTEHLTWDYYEEIARITTEAIANAVGAKINLEYKEDVKVAFAEFKGQQREEVVPTRDFVKEHAPPPRPVPTYSSIWDSTPTVKDGFQLIGPQNTNYNERKAFLEEAGADWVLVLTPGDATAVLPGKEIYFGNHFDLEKLATEKGAQIIKVGTVSEGKAAVEAEEEKLRVKDSAVEPVEPKTKATPPPTPKPTKPLFEYVGPQDFSIEDRLELLRSSEPEFVFVATPLGGTAILFREVIYFGQAYVESALQIAKDKNAKIVEPKNAKEEFEAIEAATNEALKKRTP